MKAKMKEVLGFIIFFLIMGVVGTMDKTDQEIQHNTQTEQHK